MAKMTFDMDDKLHDELRIAAIRSGTSIKKVLNDCAQRFVNEVETKRTDHGQPDRTQDERPPYG